MMKVILLALAAPTSAQEWIFDPPTCFGVGEINSVTFFIKKITGNVSVFGNWEKSAPLEEFGGLRIDSETLSPSEEDSRSALTYNYAYNRTGTFTPRLLAIMNGKEWEADLGSVWVVSEDSCEIEDPPIVKRKSDVEWVVGFTVCSGVGQLNRIALVVSSTAALESIAVSGTWDDDANPNDSIINEVLPPRNESYTVFYEHVYTNQSVYVPYFTATWAGKESVADLDAPWNMLSVGCSRTGWTISSAPIILRGASMMVWIAVAVAMLS